MDEIKATADRIGISYNGLLEVLLQKTGLKDAREVAEFLNEALCGERAGTPVVPIRGGFATSDPVYFVREDSAPEEVAHDE